MEPKPPVKKGNPFASLNSGALEGPDTAFKNALEKAFPKQGQVVRRPFEGSNFALPISALVTELFAGSDPTSAASGKGSLETGSPIDVTDPAVDTGDTELTGFEKFVRLMRRVGRAGHYSALGVAGPLTPGSGLNRAYQEGLLAPPKNKEDAVIDMAGSILAGLGVFSGAGLLAGGIGAATGTTSVNLAEAAGSRLLPKSIIDRLVASSGGRLTAEKITGAVGGIAAFDVPMGAVSGVGEGIGEKMLNPEEDPHMARKALEFAGIGAGLGTLFRIRTAANMARSSFAMSNLADVAAQTSDIAIVPGITVGDKTSVLVKGNVRFRGPKGYTKPTEEELLSFKQKSLEKSRAQIEQAPEAEAVKSAMGEEDLPADINTPENKNQLSIMSAMYYEDEAVGKAHELGKTPGRLEAELNELAKIQFDPSLPLGVRLSAGARVRALKSAGEMGTGTEAGWLPMDIERAAVSIIRRVKPEEGSAGIERIAADIAVNDGKPVLANRIREISKLGGLPERFHDEVTKRINKVSNAQSRGMKEGTWGLHEGKLVQIAEDPKYGLAMARSGDELVLVKSENFKPFPKGGGFAKLKDGRVVKVKQMNPDKGSFIGVSQNGVEGVYSADDIGELMTKAKAARARTVTEEIGATESIPPVKASTASGEPVTVVGVGEKTAEVETKSGRRKKIAKEEVKQSTAAHKPASDEMLSGQELNARMDAMGAAMRGETSPKPIVDFAPGTIPDKEHKIVFVRVPKDRVAEYEAFSQTGESAKIKETLLGSPKKKLYGNVLPGMATEDEAVYAVEVPKAALPLKLYDKVALNAIEALKGKSTVEHYASGVELPDAALSQARVYRVPSELHKASVRPIEQLKGMDQESQTKYLRNLIAFNENIPAEVAAPIKKSAAARSKTKVAVETGDHQTAVASEAEQAAANVEAVEKLAGVKTGDEVVKTRKRTKKAKAEAAAIPSTQENLAVKTSIAEEAKAQDPELSDFTPKSLEDWHSSLDNMMPTEMSDLVPVQTYVSLSELTPGQRILIHKEMEPNFVRTGSSHRTSDLTPDVEPLARYVMTPVDADGNVMNEAVTKVTTPNEVTDYLYRQGYSPTYFKHMNAEFVHAENPSIIAKITMQNNKSVINMGKAELGASGVKKSVLLEIGENIEEEASGATVVKEMLNKQFDTPEAAMAYLNKTKFRRVDNSLSPSPEYLLTEMPALSEIGQPGKMMATEAHERMNSILGQYFARQRLIPPRLAEYASGVGKRFFDKTGMKPYNKFVRKMIGVPHVDDLGPKGMSSVGDLEGMGFEVQGLPSDVKQTFKSLRVDTSGANVGKALKGILTMLDADKEVTPRFGGLKETRAGIMQRTQETIQRIKDYFEHSKLVTNSAEDGLPKEFVEQTKELLAQARVVEKISYGGRPTASEISRLRVYNEEIAKAESTLGVYGAPQTKMFAAGPHGQQDHLVMPKNDLDFFTVLRNKDPELPNMRAAQEIDGAQKQQSLWANHFAKNIEKVKPTPSSVNIESMALAKYNGQAVEVISSDPTVLLGGEVKIRIPATGEEMLVDRGALEIATTVPKTGIQEVRVGTMSDWWLEGKYAQYYKSEAPIGAGAWEKTAGLAGETDIDVVGSKMFERTKELLANTTKTGRGKNASITGSAETMDELMEIYRRSQWMDSEIALKEPKTVGKPTSVVYQEKPIYKKNRKTGEITLKRTEKRAGLVQPVEAPEPMKRLFKPSELVLKAVEDIDPKLVKPFKHAAYLSAKAKLGNHPFADLQAQAFAGYLNPAQETILRGWAKELGVSQKTPLARMVVELQERRLLDPTSARYAIQMNKEGGMLKMLTPEKGVLGSLFGGVGKGGEASEVPVITFKTPRINDLSIAGEWFGSTWKIMRKHPLTRLFSDLVYSARERELKGAKSGQSFIRDLEGLGLKFEDRKAIRNLYFDARREGWKSWNDVTENSAAYKALSEEKQGLYGLGYHAYETMFENGLEDIIRGNLQRRVKYIKFDPKNDAHIELAESLDLDPAEIKEGMYLLPKNPDLLVRNGHLELYGEQPDGWNADEIESFLSLRRNYKSAADLPAEVPSGVTPERYEEMKETFDIWKNYGIDNYWPLVHEGNIAITAREGEVVGWAQSAPDAWTAIRQLRKDGRLAPSEDVHLETRGQMVDDILVKMLPKNEWKNHFQSAAAHASYDADEVRAVLMRTDRPEEFVRKPGQVHSKTRQKALEPVFDDPDREIMVYLSRINRMKYRWDVMKAHKILEDGQLDRTLSDAYGTPRLHGENGMTNLKSYTKDFLSRALGEQSGLEQWTDKLWQFLNWAQHAPVEQVKGWVNGEKLQGVWRPSTYFTQYAGKRGAADFLKMQSVIRLGGSVGSAIANWTQFLSTTVPKMIGDGLDGHQSADLIVRSWAKGHKFAFKALTTGKRPEGTDGIMWDMIQETGIDLQAPKQLAGGTPGSEYLGSFPIKGESAGEYAVSWANYIGMFGFNGAEKTNRFSTAIAAFEKYAHKAGTKVENFNPVQRQEAVSYARQLVKETQFAYDELSIPKVVSTFGPIGRVLLQFKPFMLSMMSYEKDLWANALMKRDPTSLAQITAHYGALFALGGAAGMMYNPFIGPLTSLAKMTTGKDLENRIPLSSNEAQVKSYWNRRAEATPDENFVNSMHYRAEDFLYYGLPGLLHLSMGQRVGVSGQEMMNTLDAPGILGPHLSSYYDLAKLWGAYAQNKGSAAGLAGGAATLAAKPFVTGALSALFPKYAKTIEKVAGAPFVGASTAIIGGGLASYGSDQPLFKFRDPAKFLGQPDKGLGQESLEYITSNANDFFHNSPEGAQLRARTYPTLLRNTSRTLELLAHHDLKDMNGQPMNIPMDEVGEEIVTNMLGVPTIRRDEYSSMISFLNGEAGQETATRQGFINRIANAWANSDFETAYETIFQAQELGIDIPQSSIDRELEAITAERMETMRKKMPTSVQGR